MTSKSLTSLILSLLSLMLMTVPAAARDNRFVVVFQQSGDNADAARNIMKAGGKLVEMFPEAGIGIAVSGDPDFASRASRAKGVLSAGPERFQRLPAVEVLGFVEGEPTPGDVGYFLYQWDIRRVGADQAWEVTSGSHDTVVAVIDTGIAWNHPDLAANVVFHGCYSTSSTCSDYPSLSFHATHVAGTIAAAFGGGAVVGVGPDLGLASYNVFELDEDDEPVAYDSSIWRAMLNAAARGFDVINLSLGGYVVFPLGDAAVWTAWNRIADYVTRQGVTIVASAGNGESSLNGPVAHVPSDLTGVICVGATGIRPDPDYPQEGAYDVLADYSNSGAQITLAAPGGDLGPEGTGYPFPAFYYAILSDFVNLDPFCAAVESCPDGYAWATGTSMAAPHVSAAAALLKDMYPHLNPQQITAILKRTGEKIGSRQLFGSGMLDVPAALGIR